MRVVHNLQWIFAKVAETTARLSPITQIQEECIRYYVHVSTDNSIIDSLSFGRQYGNIQIIIHAFIL